MRGVRPIIRLAAWPAWMMIGALAVQLSAQRGGPPTSPQAQAGSPAGTGLVLGQVVDGRDGRPIAGAIVSLGGSLVPTNSSVVPGPWTPRRVLADTQGRFVFPALPAGSFLINASATGYQTGAAGQLRPGGASRPTALAPDQKLSGVTITLWKTAAISGTVIDESGDPVIGANVRTLVRLTTGGSVTFSSRQSARTDDRGVYRISGLNPGQYIVALPSSTTTMPISAVEAGQNLNSSRDGGAAARAFNDQIAASGVSYPNGSGLRIGDAYLQGGPNGVPAVPSATGVLVQPTVFYPNAATSTAATVITLGPGDERSSVDFQLDAVRGRTVSGMVTGLDGPAGMMGVRLLPSEIDPSANDNGLESAQTLTTPNGQFTFVGVPPGSYRLRVMRVPRPINQGRGFGPGPLTFPNVPQPPPPPVAPTDPTLFGQISIAVSESDLNGLSVPLRVGPRLSGRVQFDGAAKVPALGQGSDRVMVTLIPSPGPAMSAPLVPAAVDASGQFTTMSVPPGKYLVQASAPGWSLKNAMVDGRDASQTPLDLDGNDVSGVMITFYDRPSQLAGTVRNSKGEVDDTAIVYFFRSDYTSWIRTNTNTRRVGWGPAGAGGHYNFTGLRAGDYLVVALNEALLGDASDTAAVIESAAPYATRVTIGEGAKPTQDLTTAQVRIR